MFLCFVLAVTGCSADKSPYPDGQAIACGVVLSHLRQQIAEFPNRRIVVSDEWNEPFPVLSGGRWSTTHDHRPTASPSDELIARMEKQRKKSAVRTCPTLQAYLKNAHIEHGSRAVDKVIFGGASEMAVIIGLSPAAVSDDGKEALIMISVTEDPLAESGFLEHLTKDQAGEWIAVARSGLWVS